MLDFIWIIKAGSSTQFFDSRLYQTGTLESVKKKGDELPTADDSDQLFPIMPTNFYYKHVSIYKHDMLHNLL